MHPLFPLSKPRLSLLTLPLPLSSSTTSRMSMTFAEAAALRKAAQRSVRARPPTRLRSDTPRPPPPKAIPDPIMYEAVARPGAYYERPKIKRDLPIVKTPWRTLLAVGLAGVSGWTAFVQYAMNQERLSSSVVRQILQNLREEDLVRQSLGVSVRPEPQWYLNGDPWITGAINMLQGNVDISFRVKGSKGAGTLYFTSIRKVKGEPFTVLRYKIICDDGTVINLPVGLSKQ